MNLRGLSSAVEDSFWVVREMPLVDLTLFSGATDVGLEYLRGKPLTRLVFGCGADKFTATGLEVLKGMPLVDLRATGTSILTGAMLHGLPLKRLEVSRFSDSDLEAIAGMGLVELEILGCEKMTDMGLKVLEGIPLQKITFWGGDAITDAGLETFRGMDFERVALMTFMEITDAGLEVFAGRSLRDLSILYCPKITKQGVMRVAGSATCTFLNCNNNAQGRARMVPYFVEAIALVLLCLGNVWWIWNDST